MPRAFDPHQLIVDRDPLNQLIPDFGSLGALGEFNLAEILRKAILAIIEEMIKACTNVFITGLKALGVGTTELELLGSGLQNFVDGVLRFLLCDPDNPAGVTPQDFLTFLYGILTEIGQNPFVAGLIDLGESFGAVGNAGINKAFKGLLGVLESVCSLLGVGQLPQNPGDWAGTPQDIINFIKSITDVLYNNPIIAGLRQIVVDPAGNFLLDTLRGLTQILDALAELIGGNNTTPQDILEFFQGAVNTLWGVLTGTPNPTGKSVDDLLTALTSWFDGSKIVEAITGVPGTFDALLNAPLVGQLVAQLTGQNGDDIDLKSLDISQLGTWAKNLLSNTSDIPASKLYGTISEGVFGTLPVSHINLTKPNLLSQGSFGSAETILAGEGWTWDSESHSSSIGSAKVICNGTVRHLYSNQTVLVTPGDRLELAGWIKTSGFSGSNTSIQLALIPFAGTQAQTAVVIASGGAAPSWTQIKGSSEWTVPTGVTSVRVKLTVTSAATAGSVLFDDIWLNKTGLMGQSLVEFLMDAWNEIWRGAFGLPPGTVVTGKTVFDMFTALSNPLTIANGVGTNLSTLNTTLQTVPETVVGALNPVGIGNMLLDGVASVGTLITGLFNAFGGAVTGTIKTVAQLLGIAGFPLQEAQRGITNAGIAKGVADTANYAATQAANGVNTLKNNLTGGWVIETITTNGYVWTNPGNITTFWVVCFGGGACGTSGPVGAGYIYKNAGSGGDYVAQQINPSSIPSTVTCTIGLGNTTNKTTTSFGSVLSTATNTGSYVGSPLGYFPTVSLPGRGGDGGGYIPQYDNYGNPNPSYTGNPQEDGQGLPGSNSFAATGGGGGYFTAVSTTGTVTGSAGGNGGNGPNGGSSYAGGAGGGGGGATSTGNGTSIGGKGGNGGFPGGGGGGGGGAVYGAVKIPGAGGLGANGAIYLIYQKAATG